MKELNFNEDEHISGAGIGLGDAISGIGHVIEGGTHVYNAATGDNVGEGLGGRWGSGGASDYCKWTYARNHGGSGGYDQAEYKQCMKNPALNGYQDTGPW
ncbi:hypothetical protein S965_005023 [Salmonella enterica subsp. salamae]|nr:hypothetical protein [Salmonella enterica subsp. salamae]